MFSLCFVTSVDICLMSEDNKRSLLYPAGWDRLNEAESPLFDTIFQSVPLTAADIKFTTR